MSYKQQINEIADYLVSASAHLDYDTDGQGAYLAGFEYEAAKTKAAELVAEIQFVFAHEYNGLNEAEANELDHRLMGAMDAKAELQKLGYWPEEEGEE